MKTLSRLAITAGLVALCCTRSTSVQACSNDCNGDCEITVDEITGIVDCVLGTTVRIPCCPRDNADGTITISNVIEAVNSALYGCECPPPDRCGDKLISSTEECDDGGVCIGGANAGNVCGREGDCVGNGVCIDGINAGTSCVDSTDCAGAGCIHCVPEGGDGCAANCTTEVEIPTTLVSGVGGVVPLQPGTSGLMLIGEALTITVPFAGTQTIVAGHPRADDPARRVPYVVRAASVHFPKIAVSALACACVRGIDLNTCGGTLFNIDGSASTSCTPGFSNTAICPEDKPCASVHGVGNSASGVISCGPDGLDGVDLLVSQNSGGEGPVLIAFGGHGPTGSAIVFNSTAIGTRVGACPAQFCGPADLLSERGIPTTLPLTTGRASAAGIFPGNSADSVVPFRDGPYFIDGTPANCAELLATPPSLSGYGLAGAYPSLGLSTVGDGVVLTRLVVR